MDFPQRPNGGNGTGDDGNGRQPRKIADNDDNDQNGTQRIEAFGDGTDLPVWAFLFLAALFAEQFRCYCTC